MVFLSVVAIDPFQRADLPADLCGRKRRSKRRVEWAHIDPGHIGRGANPTGGALRLQARRGCPQSAPTSTLTWASTQRASDTVL